LSLNFQFIGGNIRANNEFEYLAISREGKAMRNQTEYAGLRAVERAAAAGDLDALRRNLFELSDDERSLLEAELGAHKVRVLFKTARRARRDKRGRVVLINGIMGALLDSVDRTGDIDRIWINVVRLMAGRIAQLKLPLNGEVAHPSFRIQVGGLHDTYLAMLLALGRDWHVLPYPFDWRADIDKSAEGLAAAIQGWAKNEPVHIVAHSMGGLVARRFIQRFPEIWNSMNDPSGEGRGGRLIMCGTPNRGSFAIPLALTGEDKAVKLLTVLDVKHSRRQLLGILHTFLGAYQMLPSPKVDLEDDHADLFSEVAWGKIRAHQALLDRACEFQRSLHPVIDADRMIYVAGYGVKTPSRIQVESPGRFRYQLTADGDGRVPHALGLIEGVRTFWLAERHGDLVTNERVLDGLTELLATGETDELESQRPVRRMEELDGWKRPEEFELSPDEAELVRSLARGRTAKDKARKSDEVDAARTASIMMSDYLGDPRGLANGESDGEAGLGQRISGRTIELKPHKLRVEVVWGEITGVEGDVYCVGHYQNVLPQAAEDALDRAISGEGARPEDRLLRRLTEQGVLRGALGDINFYPWLGKKRRIRQVAVAGMGHPGSFSPAASRRLACSLAWAIGSLPDLRTVCTVLIGSGDGALSIDVAAASFLQGIADALQMGLARPFRTLRIVELHLQRAYAIQNFLREYSGMESPLLKVELAPAITKTDGGEVSEQYGLALALSAAARIADENVPDSGGRALDAVLRRVPAGKCRKQTRKALKTISESLENIEQLAAHIHIEYEGAGGNDSDIPTRISYGKEQRSIAVAAITNTVVAPKKILGIDYQLVLEAAQKATDPAPEKALQLAAFLNRLLVPEDFRALLNEQRPIIFEVDRPMAVVQWELLSCDPENKQADSFLGLRAPVARQLRTTYSPPPIPGHRDGGGLKALVIGDPGDPSRGESLPGARAEAQRVAQLLREKGITVKALVGAPSGRRSGASASRLDVLDLLYEGNYDILHYAGHGDFDPDDPSRVGWLFKGGLITAAELERMERAPRLVVANACLSARTSGALAFGKRVHAELTEAALLPSLADEFFRRGVRNYIGTAWAVDDAGAMLFSDIFYCNFLPDPKNQGNPKTIGESILLARQALYQERQRYGCLWAAYQHYGDPSMRI